MSPQHPQRIAIVSRRFWPISGPSEHFVADLAGQLTKFGASIEVFTAAWQKNWPTECSFREYSIQRLSRPASGPWGTYRYQRALAKALVEYHPDAVLIFGDGEDVATVRKSLGDTIPCVLRVDHRSLSVMSRTAQKNARLDMANIVLYDSMRTRDELTAKKLKLPTGALLVADGVPFDRYLHRSLVQQASSRALLGDAHPILRVDPGQPLVITGAPMNGDGGIRDLVRAWSIVLESFPKGKLWILGDGSHARKVWDAISDCDMVYSAMMVGYFDDLHDIFQAADLYVHPLRNPAGCQCLYTAIANQVCVLATRSSHEPVALRDIAGRETGNVVSIRKDETGIIAPTGNPAALGEAITMALQSHDTRIRLGKTASHYFRDAIDIETISQIFLRALSGNLQQQNISGASTL